MEETADALELIYKSGKALYIGISSYSSKKTIEMFNILKKRNIKIFIHQPSYSLINRWFEKDLDKNLIKLGIGTIAFSPLAQGMLSDKYLKGIPKASRASDPKSALDKGFITKRNINKTLFFGLSNIVMTLCIIQVRIRITKNLRTKIEKRSTCKTSLASRSGKKPV